MRPLADQTILITGATDGLGRESARELAGRGAAVIVHGRDREKAERVVAELSEATGNDRLEIVVADLASMGEARELAARVRGIADRLDALVNNAGVGGVPRQETADGHELHLAVNHLSHFALTLGLLDLLRESAPARVVNVSSAAQAPVDFDDPMLRDGYEPYRAYAQSKLAQVLFTVELAERVPAGEVTVNALHPATLMDTRMVRESFGRPMSSVEEGVEAVVRLVAAPELTGVSGRYFDGLREAAPHAQASDPAARARLWDLSERLALG